MASPFPGMDPYLESHWRDVHASFIIYIRDQLQDLLPRGLFARVEERVFVDMPDGEGRSMYPDLRVVERSNGRGGGAVLGESSVAVAEPVVIDVGADPMPETYTELVEA